MAKFFGPVGYSVSEETSPGVWKNRIVPHNHFLFLYIFLDINQVVLISNNFLSL